MWRLASKMKQQAPIGPSSQATLTPTKATPVAYSTPLELPSSIPLRLYVCTTATRLQSSRPPYLHICTPTAHLQSSRTLEANSTSTHLHHASRASFLKAYPPAARLPSSIPPHLHARSVPPKLSSSIPLRLHACITTPDLYASIPPSR